MHLQRIRGGENTPLLGAGNPGQPTPLPRTQVALILLAQFLQPLVPQVIYPFVAQLIRDTGVTRGDETKIGYYAGLLQSVYFVTQAFSSFYLSRLSDSIGRKPVLLLGLCGSSVSVLWFGLTTQYWSLFMSRLIYGLLVGANSSIIRTVIAEICDKSNIGNVYGFLPITWSAGVTLGSLLGGHLSQPTKQYPGLFGNIKFLQIYPYFLPCAIPSLISLIVATVLSKHLDETLKEPVPLSRAFAMVRKQNVDESHRNDERASQPSSSEYTPSLRDILRIPQVVAVIACHSSLVSIDLAYRALQPLFFDSKPAEGGLGLPPALIGNILFAGGVASSIFMLFFYSRLYQAWGAKRLFVAGMGSLVPSFALFPVITWMHHIRGSVDHVVWSVILIQVLCSVGVSMAAGSVFILIANATPNKLILGTVNGASQTFASFTKAVSPALSSSLFSVSLRNNYLGGNLVYYTFICLTCTICVLATRLRH